MDRNDRRHLPGFYEMIARGERHARFGGPDHIDASPAAAAPPPVMKPKEPVGCVFGYVEPAPISRQIVQQSDQIQYPRYPYKSDYSQDQVVPPMLSNVEADCAPTILEHGPVSSRGLTNLNVDPIRANLVQKQWEKQQGKQQFDSGYSGSLNSSHSLNSRDETEFVPVSQLQNLSLGKEPNLPVFDSEKQRNHQERLTISSSDEDRSLDSVNSQKNVSLDCQTPRCDNKPLVDTTIEDYTAKFNRNLKYFEQDQDLETNIHHLLYADRDDFVLQVLDDLINYQFLDICNKSKQTILHVATIMNKPQVVRAIMAHGAPVDIRDSKGNTALHIACQKGYTQCVEVLTKHLTYDEVKTVSYQVPFRCIPQCMELKNYEGLTSLHLAVLNNHFDIVHYLVHDLGADVNSLEGKRGMTPLVCCVERRNAQMLMYLVQQCRASIHVRTYDRKNAYDLAKGRGFIEIANLLKSIDPEVASQEEEEDWIEEDFDDFTMNGQPVSV